MHSIERSVLRLFFSQLSVPKGPIDNKLALIQVMAWCRQETDHCWSLCLPRSTTPYDVLVLQCGLPNQTSTWLGHDLMLHICLNYHFPGSSLINRDYLSKSKLFSVTYIGTLTMLLIGVWSAVELLLQYIFRQHWESSYMCSQNILAIKFKMDFFINSRWPVKIRSN